MALLSPFDVVEERRSGCLVVLPLHEAAWLSNPLRLVHRATEALEPAASMLADELMRELRASGEVLDNVL